MVVKWLLEDGTYPPAEFKTVIDDEELLELEKSDQVLYIESCVQEDFEKRISFSIIWEEIKREK